MTARKRAARRVHACLIAAVVVLLVNTTGFAATPRTATTTTGRRPPMRRCHPEDFKRLDAYASMGNVSAAEKQFTRMQAFVPRGQIRMLYDCLMKACAKAGDLERAESWNCAGRRSI
eukprot:TRINITY_DN24504_c0_g1_i2.p1 TRINITY_DN24504_c0_g1~~TRINITY_DN24504_c0_g1_i2.p1  ORF type:complete len:117 (+),score=17.07 TRINITY_DN24504_c0_g1_i2:262-612(+)